MLMLRSAIQLLAGVDVLTYDTGIRRPMEILGFFHIAPKQVTIVAATGALVVALHWFLSRSRLGKAMRAVSDDPDLARVSGIDTEKVIRWTWIIGAGLAAASGVFIGIQTKVHPSMGWDLLLPLFAAAVLGGIGRPYGAIAGGLAIGLTQELSTYHWFGEMPMVDPSYKPAVAFLVMVVMLIWRPTGLFRGRVF
jgi:branched-subunit amino acid ABC-type transport system permease component